jgi:hypothetical protein
MWPSNAFGNTYPGSHVPQGRPRREVPGRVRSPIYGRMFWFSRKKFVGS